MSFSLVHSFGEQPVGLTFSVGDSLQLALFGFGMQQWLPAHSSR